MTARERFLAACARDADRPAARLADAPGRALPAGISGVETAAQFCGNGEDPGAGGGSHVATAPALCARCRNFVQRHPGRPGSARASPTTFARKAASPWITRWIRRKKLSDWMEIMSRNDWIIRRKRLRLVRKELGDGNCAARFRRFAVDAGRLHGRGRLAGKIPAVAELAQAGTRFV